MPVAEVKEALYRLNSETIPVRFVRKPKARRYILRVLPEGLVRVTIPRGGTLRYGWEFIRKHGRWIEKQLKTVPKNWENATLVFFRGEAIPLRVTDGQGDGMSVSLGPLKWSFGPEADLRGSVERELRQMAGPELIARTFELALENQLKVEAVQVRDQRSRWGSCSSRRQISLNWRLIQTPVDVRDYIIIHELMHLREMNHSAAFWEHVSVACPEYPKAEKWLRRHAKLLR